MEQPWYRQYFWLLVFGGIILFAGIISLVMVCVCRSQFSRKLTVHIRKSLKIREKRNKGQKNTVTTESSSSTTPAILPDTRDQLNASNPIPGNVTSNLNHVIYAKAHKKPAPSLQPSLNPIAESSMSDQFTVMYAKAQKKQKKSQQPELTSKYGGKDYNLDLNQSSFNDRYSKASYDSVGHFTDQYYIKEDTEASEYSSKYFNMNSNESRINERYSKASYDSVVHFTDQYYIKQDTEASEYSNKYFNMNLNESSINERYSKASYDSVGQFTDIYYIKETTEDDNKIEEYIEVIADDDEYDDVEISGPSG